MQPFRAVGSAARRRDWLEQRIALTGRRLRALRLENATQELLDVASGARRRRQPGQ